MLTRDLSLGITIRFLSSCTIRKNALRFESLQNDFTKQFFCMNTKVHYRRALHSLQLSSVFTLCCGSSSVHIFHKKYASMKIERFSIYLIEIDSRKCKSNGLKIYSGK